MVTQWFKTMQPLINEKTFVNVGIVDETDKTKRQFYLTKMTGQLKKAGFIVETSLTTCPWTKREQIYIFVKSPKQPALKQFEFIAWIHPKRGGDDYQVKGKTQAENETIARKQIEQHLKKKSKIINDYHIITA